MSGTDGILLSTLAERPELSTRINELTNPWPEFLRHQPASGSLLSLVPVTFPEYCVVATAWWRGSERVVGRGLSVPFDASGEGRTELPDQGWDVVLGWAFEDRAHGQRADAASALEITLDVGHLGRGLSYRMLGALRDAVGRLGHEALLAPVRPTAKHHEPHVPMDEFVARRRTDGLPYDPWLRTHVRSGGVVERIAPASVTVAGSLAQWRTWTGLPFAQDLTQGLAPEEAVEVPGALVPVHCDAARGVGVYVEPNVWVRHRT